MSRMRCGVLCLCMGLLVAREFTAVSGEPPVKDKATRLDALGDPLPDGAIARFGTLRLRHASETHIAYTPDGHKLVSIGPVDNALQIWSAETGKELRRFVKAGMPQRDQEELWLRGQLIVMRHHHYRDESLPPLQVATSPDGNFMVTVPQRDAAILWDTRSGAEVRRFPLLFEQGHAVAFSADGKQVAIGDCGDDMWIRVWDVHSGKEIKKLKANFRISRLAFSPDGTYLAAVEQLQTRLWHLPTGKRVRVYQGHGGAVYSVVFSPDSKRLATASRDQTVRIWEIDSEEELAKLQAPDAVFTSVAFAPDGNTLVSGSQDNMVRLWDIASARVLRLFEGHGAAVASVAFAPDGKTIASSDQHGMVRLWDVAAGKEKFADRPTGKVYTVGFAPESGEVFFAIDGGTTMVGRLADQQIARRFGKPDIKGQNWSVSPDGKLTIWMDPETGNLHAWSHVEGKELYKIEGQYYGAAAFAPDGRHFAMGGGDETLRVWHAASGREVRRLQKAGSINHLAFSPDGKTLAAHTQGEIHLWELASGRKRGRIPATSGLSGLVFSADSRFLAAGGHDETIRLWDTWNGKLVRGLVGHQWAVNAVAFSPDGKFLVSAGEDHTVRLWDTKSGDELRRLNGHRSAVQAVAFAADGRYIITGSRDTTTIVWDLKSSAGMVAALDAKSRQLEKLWHDLGHDDAAVAFESVGELAALAKDALPFLRARLQPVASVKDRVIADLIADLDDGRFLVRDQATRALEKLEGQAAAAIKKALAGTPTAEASKRLQTLADKLDAPVADLAMLRAVRALDVLDRIGNAEARDFLQALAQVAPGARFTREAHGVWQRLSKRLAKSS